jgi:hypothetical protein
MRIKMGDEIILLNYKPSFPAVTAKIGLPFETASEA